MNDQCLNILGIDTSHYSARSVMKEKKAEGRTEKPGENDQALCTRRTISNVGEHRHSIIEREDQKVFIPRRQQHRTLAQHHPEQQEACAKHRKENMVQLVLLKKTAFILKKMSSSAAGAKRPRKSAKPKATKGSKAKAEKEKDGTPTSPTSTTKVVSPPGKVLFFHPPPP